MTSPQLKLKETATDEYQALLHTVMSSRLMRKELNANWSYVQNRSLEVTDCQLVRIYPRTNGETVFEFELCLCGQQAVHHQTIFAEWVGSNVVNRCQETIVSLRKPRRRQLHREDSDLITCLPNMGLLIRFPGLDERIDGLKLVRKPMLISQILRTLKNRNGNARHTRVDVELLGHRLGKRCIVRVKAEGDTKLSTRSSDNAFILKLYKMRTERGRDVYDCMKQLSMSGFGLESSIRIPKLMIYLSEWNAIVMEDVGGVSLPDLSGDRLVDGLARAGQALRKLHNTQIGVEHHHTVDAEIDLLKEKADLVSTLLPEMAGAVEKALKNVVRGLNQCRQYTPALVHRDFYEKQILIDGDKTILLDFDTLCMADPALDVGNFIAHLELNRLQGILNLENSIAIFSDAYDGCQSNEFRRRVEIYTRSAALRLTCLYAFWPRWRHACNPLLEVANAC